VQQPKQTTTTNIKFLTAEEIRRQEFVVTTVRARAKIAKLTKQTEAEYQRRVDQLQSKKGVDVGSACIKERYVIRAAGVWGFKKQVRAILNAADKIRADKTQADAVRFLRWKAELDKLRPVLAAWDQFEAFDWKATPKEVVRKQADHKKSAATDDQLAAFHALPAVQNSQYREHFIAAEFCGARPEEFGAGVVVEIQKYQGSLALRFEIEGAKQGDGSKGQPLRAVVVPNPVEATIEVRRRWKLLADSAAAAPGKRLVLAVQASEKLTAGQKLSRSFSKAAKKIESGSALSMYSLRNRVSAQAKASNTDAESVAEILGHQSTETQRHYGRAKRSGKGISPAKIISGPGGDLKAVRNYRDRKANPIKPKKAPTPVAPVAAIAVRAPALANWRMAATAPTRPMAPKPPSMGAAPRPR
jgi:hypothetical protein